MVNSAQCTKRSRRLRKATLIATSREAAQTAEDACAIAVKKIGEENLANERQASADAQASSQAQAGEAARQKEQAQSDAAKAQIASAAAVTAAQADASQSRLAVEQAESDKAAMRTRLSEQLNSILQTRDGARGLIVSMSDVLFDTGKYSLRPTAGGAGESRWNSACLSRTGH